MVSQIVLLGENVVLCGLPSLPSDITKMMVLRAPKIDAKIDKKTDLEYEPIHIDPLPPFSHFGAPKVPKVIPKVSPKALKIDEKSTL